MFRSRRIIKRLHYVSVLVFFITSYTPSSQGSPATKKILIIAKQDGQKRMIELKSVLSAHLRDLDATMDLKVAEQSPQDIVEQVATVRKLVLTNKAFAAIWVARSNEELFLFVADKSSNKVFLRTFPTAENSWAVECDTIAATVRSALISWLEIEPLEPQKTVENTKPKKEEPKAAVSKNKTVKKHEPVGFVVGASYHLGIVHPEEPLFHGVHISLGILPLKNLEIDISARFFRPIRMSISEVDIYFRHIPLMVSTTWVWHLYPVDLGVRAGFVLDITYLEGRQVPNSRDDTSLLHPGFSPSLHFRFFLFEYLALFADVGADIFFKPYYYTWKGDSAFHYAPVQPRFSLGLTTVLGKD